MWTVAIPIWKTRSFLRMVMHFLISVREISSKGAVKHSKFDICASEVPTFPFNMLQEINITIIKKLLVIMLTFWSCFPIKYEKKKLLHRYLASKTIIDTSSICRQADNLGEVSVMIKGDFSYQVLKTQTIGLSLWWLLTGMMQLDANVRQGVDSPLKG